MMQMRMMVMMMIVNWREFKAGVRDVKSWWRIMQIKTCDQLRSAKVSPDLPSFWLTGTRCDVAHENTKRSFVNFHNVSQRNLFPICLYSNHIRSAFRSPFSAPWIRAWKRNILLDLKTWCPTYSSVCSALSIGPLCRLGGSIVEPTHYCCLSDSHTTQDLKEHPDVNVLWNSHCCFRAHLVTDNLTNTPY